MRGCQHPADQLDRLFEARDYVTGDPFTLCRCRSCLLTLTTPAPRPEAMDRYYPAGYYGQGKARRFPAPIEAGQTILYRRRVKSIEDLTGRVGRVLDIGCGRGSLLREFQRRGWEVEGTEMNDDASRHAREVLHLPVRTASVTSLPWGDEHFDAVVLWHVLEHLVQPADALHEAARVLRPGGVLLVGVPNFGSPEARLGREGWFHLDVPRHLAHFTKPVLRDALEGAGFGVCRTSCFAPEYDVFSFVQTGLNCFGLPHNLLYNLVRGRGAKMWQDRRAGWMSVLLTWLLSVPLGLASVPCTVALGCFRQGATVTFWAVKR